jgi:acyl-CoA synthetase (AMP-forming)/AMP-acid ligase II
VTKPNDAMIFKSPYPEVSIPDTDLTDYVLQRMSTYGNKTALINGITGHSISYEQLAEAIHKMAFGLGKRGLKRSR